MGLNRSSVRDEIVTVFQIRLCLKKGRREGGIAATFPPLR
jgi:hypothetical protein